MVRLAFRLLIGGAIVYLAAAPLDAVDAPVVSKPPGIVQPPNGEPPSGEPPALVRELPLDPPSIDAARDETPRRPVAGEANNDVDTQSQDGRDDRLRMPRPVLMAPPVAPLPALPRDPKVRRHIEDALESGIAPETGDPILDETLRIIQGQGSIMRNWPADQAIYRDEDDPVDAESDSIVTEAHYATAESLLRSARMLSRLPSPTPQRQMLIRQLRDEAARCLQSTAGR